jgi:hypothetical protein
MSTEDLGYILKMPVPCPHCLQESEQTVAFLINNENFSCPESGGRVDLASEKWVAFRQKLSEAVTNDPLPQ